MTLTVCDTNIVVATLKSRVGNEAEVIRLVLQGRLQLLPRLRFLSSEVDAVLVQLRDVGRSVPDQLDLPSAAASPDLSDIMFTAGAIAAAVGFIVTGNRRHFPEPRYGTAEVVNARELLARLSVA